MQAPRGRHIVIVTSHIVHTPCTVIAACCGLPAVVCCVLYVHVVCACCVSLPFCFLLCVQQSKEYRVFARPWSILLPSGLHRHLSFG
jgi:hypothetical protein